MNFITMRGGVASGGKMDGTNDDDSPIKATVVRYDERVDECTLHPVDPEESKRTTEWITAKQGTYMSLASWR